ncbi:MAG: TatD family hydrolase [Acidobacteria bacterium]|nr:TatD family hydrolase [Acidobacteriota bacterium]
MSFEPCPSSLIDTHCHLAGDEFVDDLEAVIARALEAGVTDAVCILDAASGVERQRVDRLRQLWPSLRFAAGLHPHHAAQVAADEVTRLVSEVLAQTSAVAVGEIGLDYHYDFAPREVQQVIFADQVALAVARDLPVVIHSREADADTLAVLDTHGGGRARGVFHCFTGDQALAEAAVSRGFHLSFSGIVTFPRADALREVARWVPADRWLVETDSPYLAPAPRRGGRNEPARVQAVLETIARCRGLSIEEAQAQAWRNANAVFGATPPSRGRVDTPTTMC